MKRSHYNLVAIFCITLIILCTIHFSNNASLSIYEQKKFKRLTDAQGLYSVKDDVEILTAQNFKSDVYGNERAWYIEFYNTWCGFCQRFAPSWKALAKDIKEWKDLVMVGAIDCSDDNNYPICREFEVMGYPTLKYFHEKYEENPSNLGTVVTKGEDAAGMRHYLLERIILDQSEGRGKIYPNLLPYNSSDVKQLYNSTPSDVNYVFLIVEEPSSFIGAEVAMDLHKYKNFIVRNAKTYNEALKSTLDIKKFPSLVVVSRDNTANIISDVELTREGFKKGIKHYLNINVADENNNQDIFNGKWMESNVPDMSEFIRKKEQQALKERIKKMGDVVFQMDLETALRYSLHHEVASVKAITGEKLEALKAFLSVLAKYFPFGANGQSFLSELEKKVASGGSSVSGGDIAALVADAEKEERQVFSSPNQWLACRGSSSQYRGYPCGLWKLFHYLTVNAADANSSNKSSNPLEVLSAMHGYIKNFFGCADCSRHFQEMAKKNEMTDVSSLDSSIVWLWVAHNEVNKRLSGDQTEDPEFPKLQFPTKEHCPLCHNSDDSWNLSEVLKYLKHMYSSINIQYLGSDARILHMGLEGQTTSGSSSVFKTIDSTRLPEEEVRA